MYIVQPSMILWELSKNDNFMEELYDPLRYWKNAERGISYPLYCSHEIWSNDTIWMIWFFGIIIWRILRNTSVIYIYFLVAFGVNFVNFSVYGNEKNRNLVLPKFYASKQTCIFIPANFSCESYWNDMNLQLYSMNRNTKKLKLFLLSQGIMFHVYVENLAALCQKVGIIMIDCSHLIL